MACLTVVAAEADGDNGLVAAPAVERGRVGAPSGESGCVAGFRETVAFGSDAVCAKGDAGAVGDPDLSAMVGAPTGEFEVDSLMVGVPAVGVERGLVGDPLGVRGLVTALAVGERGMVGAPVGVGGLIPALAVGVRGMVGAPVGVRGLIGMPGAMPPGPAVLRGMVGAGMGAFGAGMPPIGVAGAIGGPAIGAVVAALIGRGVLVIGVATGTGVDVGAAASETVAGGLITGTTAGTGITGLGAAAGVRRTGAFGSVGGREADGTAGGASDALSVTRTVSFFKGTLEVILFAGVLSFSLMRSGFCI